MCSIAPMMEFTDNHYRTLARLISKHSWLYTEMIAAETIVYQKGNLVSKHMPRSNNFSLAPFDLLMASEVHLFSLPLPG